MLAKKTLAFLILLAVGSAQPAQAAGCINGNPTVEQEFRYAEYVVIGTATSIKRNVPVRLAYKKGFYNSRVMIQTVSIQKQFKGAARRTITYNDEYSSAQFPTSPGKKYILFYRKRHNSELYIDVCGNSTELITAEKSLLKKIEQLSSEK